MALLGTVPTDTIIRHYESFWGPKSATLRISRGPVADLPESFSVAEFGPTPENDQWAYATVGFPHAGAFDLEVFLLAATQDVGNVELLYALAHFHLTGEVVGLGHTVNLGRPWVEGSALDHGLLSTPFTEPEEFGQIPLDSGTRFVLWLLPITASERAFKVANGLDALEEAFDELGIDYLDPFRAPAR